MSFLVLPLDDDLLARVEQTAEARGLALDVSRGEEQVIVCVARGGSAAELLAALPERGAIELVELQRREVYARQRARRRLLSALVASLALLTAVGWAIPIAGFLRPPPTPLHTPGFVPVASVQRLPPGGAQRVWVGERQVLVVQLRAGRYFALDGRCTFMEDCQLEWDPGRERVVCPCHGCVFDVYGNIVSGPPWAPLPSYTVERIGDRLYLGERK